MVQSIGKRFISVSFFFRLVELEIDHPRPGTSDLGVERRL